MSVEPANNNINDSRTKWYGQNGMDKMIGYTDKMVRTKWYLQNITDKVINQSRSHWHYDFSSTPLPIWCL